MYDYKNKNYLKVYGIRVTYIYIKESNKVAYERYNYAINEVLKAHDFNPPIKHHIFKITIKSKLKFL